MSEHSLLPIKAITPELLGEYVRVEKGKHAECHGHCRHARESAEIASAIATAFMKARSMQDRIDTQLLKTFEHASQSGDGMNSFRTFAVAMIVQGWELAKFALEEQGMDGKVQ